MSTPSDRREIVDRGHGVAEKARHTGASNGGFGKRMTIVAIMAQVGTFADGATFAAELIGVVVRHVNAIVAIAYDRAPALVLAVGAMLIVPLSALVALLARGAAFRLAGVTRRARDRHTSRTRDVPETAPWPTMAWLAIDGAEKVKLPNGDALLRIGRQDDNDVVIPDQSVHRHHALVHRTLDAHYVIVDLSGRAGNGVLVNGERLAETRLSDGDRILLGEVNLTFECRPI